MVAYNPDSTTTMIMKENTPCPSPSNIDNNSSTIEECMLELLEKEKNCDVVFVVGKIKKRKKKILCHELLLKARSPVFDLMFTDVWKSARKTAEIHVTDIYPSVFRKFLQFLYGDKLTEKVSEVVDILYVADKYQVTSLINRCEIVLRQKMNIENVLEMFQIAVLFRLTSLANHSGNFIARKFSTLIEGPGFELTEESTLINLLSRDELLVDELKLFKALLRWSSAKLDEMVTNNNKPRTASLNDHQKILHNILPLVRFPAMSLEQFRSEVVPTNILGQKKVKAICRYIVSGSKARIEQRDKLGFCWQPRATECCRINFYSYRFGFKPSYLLPTVFKPVPNHIDTIEFPITWKKQVGSSCKFQKAALTSVILRGPNYAFLRDNENISCPSWASTNSWKVSLKLEKCSYGFPFESQRVVHQTIENHGVEIFGDQNTEVCIQPPLVLVMGYKYRISVSYQSEVYLPRVGKHKIEDRIHPRQLLKRNLKWEMNEGTLKLGLKIRDPKSLQRYDAYHGRDYFFYHSHSIRSLKLHLFVAPTTT